MPSSERDKGSRDTALFPPTATHCQNQLPGPSYSRNEVLKICDTPITSFYWFLRSDWVNSHFLHQGSSAMAIPHFASWEFSPSVSRILMTWMPTFCSLTEVVKELPGKKHSRGKNPPAQREMFYFNRSPFMVCLCSSQEHHCSARALPDLQTVKALDWTQQAQQGNWHLPARRTWRLWTKAEGST